MFPQNPKASNISIASISPTLVSLTHSLKRQVRRRGGQRWLIDVNYPPLSREDFAPIWAFSIAQQGQFKTFKYIPEIYGSTSGSATGELTVGSSAIAGSSAIPVQGILGTLKIGDFINFAGHYKVYMITKTTTPIWTAGSCSDPAYTDQASCEAGTPIWTNVPVPAYCVWGDFTDQTSCEIAPWFSWVNNECVWANGLDESTCLAGEPDNYWVEAKTGSCSDPAYTDQASCEAGTPIWTAGSCSDPAYTDQASCEADTSLINIEPALHQDIVIGEVVIYRDVPFTVAFTGDITNMSVAVNQYVSFNLKLVEIV